MFKDIEDFIEWAVTDHLDWDETIFSDEENDSFNHARMYDCEYVPSGVMTTISYLEEYPNNDITVTVENVAVMVSVDEYEDAYKLNGVLTLKVAKESDEIHITFKWDKQ